ncbi:MAG: hypothetical protein MZV64_72645 [Ignavibacteriales bacterium]|nr:hypothetical protein [Ignavibacteriales bacterium]
MFLEFAGQRLRQRAHPRRRRRLAGTLRESRRDLDDLRCRRRPAASRPAAWWPSSGCRTGPRLARRGRRARRRRRRARSR